MLEELDRPSESKRAYEAALKVLELEKNPSPKKNILGKKNAYRERLEDMSLVGSKIDPQ